MSRWYLYAVADGDPGELPVGIGSRSVSSWALGGLHLIGSEFGGCLPPGSGRDELLTHERVVEAAMARVTVLPFRFATVTDEPALSAFVDRYGGRLRERLGRVAGHVEVTLKILERTAHTPPAGAATEAPLASAVATTRPAAHGSGTSYLLARRAHWQREAQRQDRAAGLVARLDQALDEWVSARHHRLAPSPHVLATVTHLILRSAVGSWTAAAGRLKDSYPELDFVASGPWPPYHFSEVTGDDGPDAEPGVGCPDG